MYEAQTDRNTVIFAKANISVRGNAKIDCCYSIRHEIQHNSPILMIKLSDIIDGGPISQPIKVVFSSEPQQQK